METNHSWNPFKTSLKEKRGVIAKAHALSKSRNENDTYKAKLFKAGRDSNRFDRQNEIKRSKGLSTSPSKVSEFRRRIKDFNDTKLVTPLAHSVLDRNRKEAREKRRSQAKSLIKST